MIGMCDTRKANDNKIRAIEKYTALQRGISQYSCNCFNLNKNATLIKQGICAIRVGKINLKNMSINKTFSFDTAV